MKKLILNSLLVASSLLFFSACSDDDKDAQPQEAAVKINGKLNADGRFDLFVDALKRTGLDTELELGTHTVFAPSDAVFNSWMADLGYADLNDLQQSLGTDDFKALIAYHLMSGSYSFSKLQTGYWNTLGINNDKDTLSFYLAKSNILKLNDNSDVQESIEASNGTIHLINRVNPPLSVYQLLKVNPDYSSLEASIDIADGNLNSVLSDPSMSYTLFAPNNAAFDTLVAITPNVSSLFELMANFGTAYFATIINYHTSEQAYLQSELQTGSLNTRADDGAGGKLSIFVNIGTKIRLIDNSASTEDAVILSGDIGGTNGVVHLIDRVMLSQ